MPEESRGLCPLELEWVLGTELRSFEDQQVLLIAGLDQQIFFNYFKITCICNRLCVVVYMCRCCQNPEESVAFHGAGLIDSCQLPYGCWE